MLTYRQWLDATFEEQPPQPAPADDLSGTIFHIAPPEVVLVPSYPSPTRLRENDVDYIHRAPPHTEELWRPSALQALVEWLIKVVRAEGVEALAATGHSGLVPASIVAFTLGLPLIAVRKPSEDPQSGFAGRVNGVLPDRPLRYGIIDDLIASGATVANILSMCGDTFPKAHCDVVFMYRSFVVGEKSGITLGDRERIGERVGKERAAKIKIVGREGGLI